MQDLVVSIVIITRNRPFLLGHCIERVLNESYSHKEIIVVDSSSDDVSEKVVADFPNVISIRLNGQNHNMPQARNEGICASSGDIVAFIDDDSMIQPGWLDALITAYQDETIGAVGGRVIEMPEPYCNQDTGTPRLEIGPSGRVTRKGLGLVGTMDVEVDHLAGGNMSFRRSVLEQIGGFDPNYTVTNLREETDICLRVKRAGWRILFVPAVAVVHFSLRAIQKPYFLERPVFQFSNGRNCMYFAIKHFGFKPGAMAGQLKDTGKSCGRAAYFIGLFGVGAVAQIAGRVAGVGAGIAWMLSNQRQAASAPKIDKRTQVTSDPVVLATTSQSESLI